MEATERRETPVIDNGQSKIAEPRQRFDPTRIFVQKDRLVWFWFGFAMLVLLGAAVDRYFLVQSFKQRERVIVIDPANTFYVSPLLKFEEAKALHVEQSTLAATAFFRTNLLRRRFPSSCHSGCSAIPTWCRTGGFPPP